MNEAAAPFDQRPDIPGYRLDRRLGEGGMAQVWLAMQLSLDRPVAIKVLAVHGGVTQEMAARFEREARMIARLDHPRIVGIYDVGRTTDGRMYYTMPHLPNGDLARRDLRYAPQEILRVVRALLDALEYAHRHNVVHRDVKPANILFDKNDRPLLADFGIALARSDVIRMTSQRQTLGSTGYMSPEQARSGDVDGRADLYSLGVVCYELLTGDLPYHGADPLAVAIAHVEEPIPRLPVLLRPWQPWIDKALAKAPDARFQDAAQMREGLDAVERRLARAEIEKPQEKRRGWLLMVLLVAVAGAALWRGSRDTAPPDRAVADASTPSATATPTAPARATSAAPTPAAATPVLDAARIDQALGEGGTLLARGNAVLPESDNAAERYLEVLKAAPAHSEARSGLDNAFATAAKQAASAILAGDGTRAAVLYDATYAAAERSGIPNNPAWFAFSERYVEASGQALNGIAARLDHEGLDRLAPALERATMNAPALAARRAQVAAMPSAGSTVRDTGGTTVVIVPAVRGESRMPGAFALGVHEVTRGEYAAFARATKRAAARCRDSGGGPLKLLRRATWDEPGFHQGEDEPVVCVTGDDAAAYAAWLAQRSGKSYRLPTRAEWRHAAAGTRGSTCRIANVRDASTEGLFAMGKRYDCNDGAERTSAVGRYGGNALGLRDLAGNVAEWLGECARGSGAACSHRWLAGTSWRDGPESPLLGPPISRAADAAATDIGFRVARDL